MDATPSDHHHQNYHSNQEKTHSIGLQTLKTRRNVPRPNNELPIEYVGLFSFLFITWMDGFMWRVFRRGLPRADVWACPPADTAELNAPILERMWKEEMDTKKEKASLFKVAFKFARSPFIISTVIILMDFFISTIAQTIVYMKLLEYLSPNEKDDPGLGYGIALVVALFLIQIGYSLPFPAGFTISIVMAARIRAGFAFIMFKKILNSRNLGHKSIGHYVNIFANDSTRIFEGFAHLPIVLAALFLLVGPTVYAILLLDEYALIGFAFILLVFPIQILIGRQIIRVRQKSNPLSDKRVKMMKEMLENAKSVKMFAWETPFSNMINSIREKEMTHIACGNTIISFSLIASTIMIGMAIMITIIVSAVNGKQVTNVEIFTYVILYTTFNGNYSLCIQAFKHLSECFVALKRCQEIMEEPDYFTNNKEIKSSNDYTVDLNQATMIWPSFITERSKSSKDKDPELTVALHNISLQIKKKSTIGIAGPVGSGKSALIGAMLGKLDVVKGSCNLYGSVAYVPQHPWIFNASLRDNITFHMPFDKDRYSAILDACCLVHDISLLPDGDLTEIGERGVNLSGGQKHRVNIARALYSDRDIVLMDDPFSALDPDIAEDIFRNAILHLLQEKTIILVTHVVHFLPHCDHVVFMDHGEIRQQGTHEELMHRDQVYQEYTRSVEDSEYCNLAREDLLPYNISINSKDVDSMTHPAQSLMVEEASKVGAVSMKTYWAYISATGGLGALALAVSVSILAEGVRAFSFWWLGEWVADGSGNTTVTVARTTITLNGTSEIITQSMISPFISDNPNVRFYVLIYGISLVGIIVVYMLRSFVIMKLMKRASTRLHKKLFTKVLASPMRFFDTTPIGQIINRFSKDHDEIDSGMPPEVDNFLTILTRVLMYFVLIGAIASWSFLVIPVMTVIFVLFYRMYRVGMREMKRHHNVSWSPLLGLVTNSVLGLSCVRAYAKEDEIKRQFCKHLNYNTTTLIGYQLIKWWCAQRTVLIVAINISVVVLILVFVKSHIPVEMAAVTMIYGMQICGMALTVVLTAVETQTRFTSVERISDYIDNLEQEKNSSNADTGSSNWPESGDIEFIKYNMRYRPGLPLVLKNLTFTIINHEKIGIVGRSGSGKSSLTNALFRLCEAAAGKILISGVDISTVSLQQLRSNIAIIPQEPLLFSGSIRSNLDPFDQFNDSQLWEALDRCHMKVKITSMVGQLSAVVTEGGKNLSAGERQLLCLARVLLKQTRILILDEATASVDNQTSRKIQQCLHVVLQDCTMLVIAHRLETVMNCEKVLVIGDGEMVEFDKPDILAQDEGSHFYHLMIGAQDI